MRMPRPRFTLRGLMILVAVVGAGMWGLTRLDRGWTYYAAGWWEAERELWRGDPTIYSRGGVPIGDFCNVDRETGLTINPIFGCVVSEGDHERIAGHNGHIKQYILCNGLPRNSFKPWEKELFDLKRFFDDRSRTEVPTRLIVGGPPVVSPDGRNSVRPVVVAKQDGTPSDLIWVVIAAGNAVLDDWDISSGASDSTLLWGPEKSRLVVIRSILENQEHYAAFDLRTGSFLREETWIDGKKGDLF